jgi:hypothetical protein
MAHLQSRQINVSKMHSELCTYILSRVAVIGSAMICHLPNACWSSFIHPHHVHHPHNDIFKTFGIIGGGDVIRVARRRGVGRPCSKPAGGGVPERERGQR